MINCIIASTSTLPGQPYLDYLLPTLKKEFNSKEVLFIPYARPSGISFDDYSAIAEKAFNQIDIKVYGIHEFESVIEAVRKAKNIFVGGGNTFLLVKSLYQHNLITPLQEAIHNGVPYLGTSAGSNICGLTMQTTNDMPIVQPPSHKTLSIVPFNINPHFQDPLPKGLQKGETRATRIKEFHQFNSVPVVGLREGSWIHATGNKAILKGELTARIFEQNKDAYEVEVQTDLNRIFSHY